MATVKEPARSTAPSKNEAFVEQQLQRARTRIRLLDSTSALLGLCVGTLVFCLGMMLLDRWLELPSLVRQWAFLGYLLVSMLYLGVALVWPLCKNVNPYYAALRVEQTVPGAKNSIVNWLDLHAEKLPGAIRSAVGARAAKDLTHADLDRAISGRRVFTLGGAAVALCIGFVVALAILGPSTFFSLFARAVQPFTETTQATRTRLTLLQPSGGDTTVPVNASILFAVRVDGRVPDANKPDAVRLLLRYNQNDPVYHERPMERGDGDREWVYRVHGFDLQNGFWYKIAGGDDETKEFRVQVRSSPLITGWELKYRYRPYLVKPNEVTDKPDIEAIRGTEVTVRARTNRTVKDGWLQIDDDTKPKPLPAFVDGDTVQFKFIVERDGNYRVRFTSAEDEASGDSLRYTIKALPDLAPEVRLTEPGKDITLPANGVLSVAGSATDDHGLAKLTLRMKIKGGNELYPKVYREEEGTVLRLEDGSYQRSVDAYKEVVELDKLRDAQGRALPLLKAGAVLEYWLEAVDACDYPPPGPNVGVSKTFKVTIADPDKDKKKVEDQKNEAKKQKDEQDKKQDQQKDQENKAAKDRRDQEQKQNGGNNNENKPQQSKEDKDFKDKQQQLKNELDKQKDKGESKPDQKQPDKGENKGEGQNPKPDQKGGGDKGEGKPQPKPGDDQKPGEGKPQDKGDNGKPQDKGAGKPEPKDKGKQGQDSGGGKGEGKPQPQKGASQPGGQKGDDKKSGEKQAGDQKGQGEGKPDPKGNGQGKPEAKGSPNGSKGTPKESGDAGKPDGKNDNTPAASKGDGTGPPQGEPKPTKGDGTEQPGTGTAKEGSPGKGGKQGTQKPDAGNQGAGSGASKPEEAREPNAGDVGSLAKDMKSGDADKRDAATRKLQQIAKNAKDPQVRKDAEDALKKEGQPTQAGDTPKNPDNKTGQGNPETGTGKTAPKGEKPTGEGKVEGKGQPNGPPKEKGPNGGMSDTPTGTGKSEEGKTGAGDSKQTPPGPQGSKGTGDGTPGSAPGSGSKVGDRPDNPDDPDLDPTEGNLADLKNRERAGELQLERFKEKVTPEMLQKLKMSKEEYARFLKDMERRVGQVKSRVQELEKLERSATGGNRPGSGVTRTQGSGARDNSRVIGPLLPPAEFQKSYRDFTEELSRIKAQEK